MSDGEYRWLNWLVGFSDVEGWDLWSGSWKGFLANPDLALPGETPGSRGEDAVVSFRAPAAARLALRENFPVREFRFAQSVAKVPEKAMITGADRVAQICGVDRSPMHRDADEFLADVVRIQRQMVGELVDAGCHYVQLDEPSYTGYVDPPTLERLLGGLAFDRLLLDYDTERGGGFEPLRFVPKGKTVVLGLVTAKNRRVETADELRARIDDAAPFVPLNQLAISPQCGFASGIGGSFLTEDEQWRKIDVLLEVARKTWG